MAILEGFELLQRLPPDSSTTLAAQVIMELAPIDMMTAVEYWLQKQVLRAGIEIDVVGIEYSNYPEHFKVRFNQVAKQVIDEPF
jgi:hypothetical protein